jgi:hypothetical protein
VKTATGLTLIAIGAVLAFAVNGHPWFLNLQVCGWIIMVIGVVGLAVPRSGYGWLRRQVVVRRGPDGRSRAGIGQRSTPSYVMINPAAVDAGAAGGQVVETETVAGTSGPPEPAQMPVTPAAHQAKNWASGDDVIAGDKVVPDEEVVEEYFPD